MPDLTELQRLAEGATPCDGWYVLKNGLGSDVRGRHVTGGSTWVAECRTDAEAAYIAAMHPDTAKKLIAVARAGEKALEFFTTYSMLNESEQDEMALQKTATLDELRTALEELK